nr:hypothetical protein [Tanacetum cinerariifolium]
MYRSLFKSKFHNKDMKEKFPDWFGSQIRQCRVDKDPGVSASSELFALACGPTPTPISVNSCVVNGVRFVVHSRDERRTTHNSSICPPGGKDEEMYYDGQSTDVDASPDIIDVDEDDDIIDEKVPLPHNLANSDDEDLVNVDDDDDMSADVAQGHGGDRGGDYRRPPHQVSIGCGGCLDKGTQKPNLGGRKASRLHTSQDTRNLRLKKITDVHIPVPIWFEWNDKETLMPLGDHVGHWSNYLGELVREFSMHCPSWHQVSTEQKARILAKIGIGMCKLPSGKIPRTFPGVLKIAKTGKEHGRMPTRSRSLAALRDQMMKSSATREYPSLIQTFFQTHTIGRGFLQDEDRALYGLGSNTETDVPYTEDEIMAIVQKGKQLGHLPGVGRVLPGKGTDVLSPPPPLWTHNSDVVMLKKSNNQLTKQVSMIMKLFRSDDKMSQMLMQLESQSEFGSGSGSGGCGDNESGDDEDGGEEEDDEEDADS